MQLPVRNSPAMLKIYGCTFDKEQNTQRNHEDGNYEHR